MKKIEQSVWAYTDRNIYNFDNEIILNYYPDRIMKILTTTPTHIVSENDNSSYSRIHHTLLELGLGHGYSTNVFANYFERHLVLDGDGEIIKKYKDKYQNNKTEIKKIFFEDFSTNEKFDVIVLGFILEHVDEPITILKQYSKFLSENGRMFLTVPNAKSLNRRVGKIAGLLDNLFCLSENDIAQGHKRYYDVESLKLECAQANLSIRRLEGIFLKPLTTNQLLQLNLEKNVLKSFCEVGINYPELCTAILAEVCVC